MVAKIVALLALLILALPVALAHETVDDTYVRVVSANPETGEYSFQCLPDDERGIVRDWHVYADDSEEEFFLNDLPADEDYTITFPSKLYYHIGCVIVDPTNSSHLWRGDLHIDLRDEIPPAEVIALSANETHVEMYCRYTENPYTVSWATTRYWGAPSEPTRRYDLNSTNKTILYEFPDHGIDHIRCVIRDQVTNEQFEAGLPIELFEDRPGRGPYIADRYGIDLEDNYTKYNFTDWLARMGNPELYPEITEEPEENQGNNTCYESLADMPVSCTGTITQDEMGGCRTIVCDDKQVLACQKSGYFEMYNQGGPDDVQICLGETCINNNGYAKSPEYPICTGEPEPYCGDGIENQESEQCDGSAPEGYTCNETCNLEEDEPTPYCGDGTINQVTEECDSDAPEGYTCNESCELIEDEEVPSACYEHVNDVPASCSEAITSDVTSGCRTIVCDGKQVLACNKGDFFEMYNQGGPSEVEICLGETCITNNGYAKSPDYPICLEDVEPYCGDGIENQESEQCDGSAPEGYTCNETCQLEEIPEAICGNNIVEEEETCDDGNNLDDDGCSSTCQTEEEDPVSGAVNLSIADWYPQGTNYVFVCASDADTYDWDFGDGSSWPNSGRSDVYHTYSSSGDYTVTCTTDEGSDSLVINVQG